MKPLLPPKSHSNISRKVARSSRDFVAGWMTLAAVILAAPSTNAINHPPFVSWIPDQRIMSGGFATQYFRIFNYDPVSFSIMKQSTSTFYSTNNVIVQQCGPGDIGCAQDGTGYKVSFNASPTGDGVTTIILRANESGTGGLIGYTSFTLRQDSAGNNPPSIGALPNQSIQLPSPIASATYTTMFVVGDLDESNVEDVVDANGNSRLTFSPPPTSSNHNVLLDSGITLALMPPDGISIMEGPRSYSLTATTVAGAIGATTVTVNLTDPDGNTTSTSFVLQVAANANVPPSFGASSDGLYLVCPVPTPNPTPPQYHFTVASNDITSAQDLRVTAISSNTNLVPNDSTHLVCSAPDGTGAGTVTIIPILPLPSPSPGVPQTSTITLSVTDDAYTRQSTLLYLVSDPSSPALSFSRPSGVYLLDPNLFQHRMNDTFLTGEMHRISWAAIETAQDVFNWNAVNDVIDAVPTNQDVSMNLTEEPCYIAQHLGVSTWCDTNSSAQQTDCGAVTPCPNGVLRAVPWDSFLRTRRDNFLQLLAQNVGTDRMARISIINTNLPGGDTGIRNVTVDFDSMPGYSREALLGAVQDELRQTQNNFPGKLVQIGFFPATDNNSAPPLWQWLYRDASNSTDANGVHLVALADEFNGIKRPRVSFFQENLAATRTSDTVSRSSSPNYVTPPLTTAYTFTPNPSFVPSFAYYSVPSNDEYNNGITFQANTPWSNPFLQPDGQKLIKTLNGSPNDGMEAAFNLEVYPPDVDQAAPQTPPPTLNAVLWAGELQSWKFYTDYLRSLAPIEPPAGLTVVRSSSTSNLISWYAVYGATSYQLQRRDLGTLSPDWVVDTPNCDPAATQCTDTTATGSQYAYRVRATNGTNTTPWTNVAVFLSENAYDGYVQKTGTNNYFAFNNAAQPGIRAGEGAGMPLKHWKGFLSFNTGALGSTTTVLAAKVRLNQATTGTNFGALGPCMVDIKKGSFNNDPTLQGSDYNSMDQTTLNAFPVINVGQNNWFQTELIPSSAMTNISNTDHTQFRIYFAQGSIANRYEGWYSGESSDNNSQPQLIVQYKE